jgi:hypothetical protein
MVTGTRYEPVFNRYIMNQIVYSRTYFGFV